MDPDEEPDLLMDTAIITVSDALLDANHFLENVRFTICYYFR